MSPRGCWTCKDRRIRCDRAVPVCMTCVRSHRQCLGYGLRLSWPNERDRKRAIRGPKGSPLKGPRRITTSRWLNTSFQDIELHAYLSDPSYTPGGVAYLPQTVLAPSISWAPSIADAASGSLLDYFESIALHTLATCEDNPYKFLGDLTRLALTDAGESSKAVLQAILAVASVHRYGLQAESVRLQGKAIRALESSAQKGMSDSEIVQHMAASMLLCSYEVQASHRTPGPWLWYVSGAKRLAHALNYTKKTLPSEFFPMVNWVYYHDVMSQFSLRHWRLGQYPAPWDLTNPLGPTVSTMSQITGVGSCSLSILEPLSEVFKNLVSPSHPRYHRESYREYLASLESRLENMLDDPKLCHIVDQIAQDGSRAGSVLDLFRLAALVYLERTSKNFSGQSAKIEAWTDAAFEIISTLRVCKHKFPLFVFGCEADSDARRILILDAISETEKKKKHTLNMQSLHQLVQSVWNQDDLQADRRIDYNEKLNTVFSAFETVPSFA